MYVCAYTCMRVYVCDFYTGEQSTGNVGRGLVSYYLVVYMYMCLLNIFYVGEQSSVSHVSRGFVIACSIYILLLMLYIYILLFCYSRLTSSTF